METIQIRKDGTILKKNKPVRTHCLDLLGHSVCLAPDFMLASFFQMVRAYPQLKKVSPLFEAFLGIIPETGPVPERSDEIKGLTFYKTIEIIGFPGTPAIQIYNSLKGRMPDKLHEPMDLKFFHLESLLGHTLSLGQLQHIVFGDNQDIFSFDTFYTLFELLEGIAWELSFNFNPLECSIRR